MLLVVVGFKHGSPKALFPIITAPILSPNMGAFVLFVHGVRVVLQSQTSESALEVLCGYCK